MFGMPFLFVLIGALLLVNGLFLSFVSNFNLGVVLTILLGAFLILCGIFYEQIRAMKVLRRIVLVLFCLETVLVSFIAIYGQVDNVTYDEEVVIVLGAGIRKDQVTVPLQLRLDRAVEYHQKNPDALIVVTGGQGFGETVTEAYAMEQYLLARGVAADQIIKEERATSTNENMQFSKAILDERLNAPYNVVVITNNFHIYRGVAIAKAEGFEQVTHLHAGLQWYNWVPCYLRESLAVLKMWVFG